MILEITEGNSYIDGSIESLCYTVLSILLQLVGSLIYNTPNYFSFSTTAKMLALAYLHETLRFTSVC
jgi:hypothetical protein